MDLHSRERKFTIALRQSAAMKWAKGKLIECNEDELEMNIELRSDNSLRACVNGAQFQMLQKLEKELRDLKSLSDTSPIQRQGQDYSS